MTKCHGTALPWNVDPHIFVRCQLDVVQFLSDVNTLSKVFSIDPLQVLLLTDLQEANHSEALSEVGLSEHPLYLPEFYTCIVQQGLLDIHKTASSLNFFEKLKNLALIIIE